LKQSQAVKKYIELESRVTLCDLFETPDDFLAHMERTSMSAIFGAVYGMRITRLDHPTMVELFDVWNSIAKSTYGSSKNATI
jgi:hypothetical protein